MTLITWVNRICKQNVEISRRGWIAVHDGGVVSAQKDNFSLWVTYPNQEIEIGGFNIVDQVEARKIAVGQEVIQFASSTTQWLFSPAPS
jgi:hypothetical protein